MNINRLGLTTTFTMVTLSILVILFGAGRARGQHVPSDRSTLVTDQVTIKQGQTARLEVENTGDSSLIIWLSFRDSEGKGLSEKHVTIKPGSTGALEYSPSSPLKPRANVVLTALVREDVKTHPNPGTKPTLRVIENGQSVRLIGAESFREMNPLTDALGTPTGSEHPPGDSASPGPQPDPISYVIDNVLSTDPVRIQQGQTARLQVTNTGDQSLVVWLFFRDSAGKVLIQKEVKIYPGADEALEYSIRYPDDPSRNPAGPHAGDFVRAAVGTKETKLLSSLKPVLRILDNKSGETIRLVGDFMRAQLGPPVSQPNAELNPKGLGGDRDQGFPIGFTTAAFANNQIGLMRLTLTSVTPESKLGTDPVVLRFVDSGGKVLAYQVATVSKGHDAVLLFSPDTGQAAIRAQFFSNDKRSLILFRPTLEIIDRQTKSVKTIEPNGFTPIGIPFYGGGAKP